MNEKSIGDRIRDLRKEKHMTQLELAKKLNVKRETVTQWETETRNIKAEHIAKLSKVFDVSCDELILGLKLKNHTYMHNNFQELTRRLSEIAEDELKRANKEFPMFHSRHEGWGVISEELYEVECEMEIIDYASNTLKTFIFNDYDYESICKEAIKLGNRAIYAASELIQVAAMCQKMIDSEVDE